MANKQELNSVKFKGELDRFLKYKNRNWSTKTLRNNQYYFGSLVSFLKDRSFNREIVEDFFGFLAKENFAQSTRRQAETAILSFVSWLFYEDVIDKNWSERIERTKIHREPRILPSQQEALRLIKKETEPGQHDNRLTIFSKMEHRACLSFIVVACGGRNFETTNILRKDISISGKELTITHGKNGPRNATIPNVPWLIEDLERRVKGLRTSNELRTLSDKTHYKESDKERLFVVNEKKLEEHMRKVGVLWNRPMNVHDLRRIFARDLKNNGCSIDDIRDVMGHKSIETTMRYLEYDTSTQARTLKNYSSEARKYRTKEEKSKELVNSAWEVGKVINENFDGEFLTMKIKII